MATPDFMLTPALFAEQQNFLQKWWWLVLLVSGLLLVPLLLLRRTNVPPAILLPSLLSVPLLLAGWFAWLQLDTRLDAQGISYRMRPLGWQHLAWAEVQRVYVRQYSPIGEFGGWGIRGSFARGKAYNVAGSQGLQLELADGRHLLLGTQRPEKLAAVLAQLPISR